MSFPPKKKSKKETPAQEAKAQAIANALHKKPPTEKQLPPWLQQKKGK